MNSDSWELAEIPLGEASEAYSLTVFNASNDMVKTVDLANAEFLYGADQRLSDLGSVSASYKIKVKQIGILAGIGLEAELGVN
ncbi:MAG: hypothetical protein ACRCT6_10410 [Notoacmeibacter sp.]